MANWSNYKTPEDSDAEIAVQAEEADIPAKSVEFRPMPHQRTGPSSPDENLTSEPPRTENYPSVAYTTHETSIPAHQRESEISQQEYDYQQHQQDTSQNFVSSAERTSHINEITEQPIDTPKYGALENPDEQYHKTPDRRVFEESIKDTSVRLDGVVKQDGVYKSFQHTEDTVAVTRGVSPRFANLPAGAAPNLSGSAGESSVGAVGGQKFTPKTGRGIGVALGALATGATWVGRSLGIIGGTRRTINGDNDTEGNSESTLKGTIVKGVVNTPKYAVKTAKNAPKVMEKSARAAQVGAKGTMQAARGTVKVVNASSKALVQTAKMSWVIASKTAAGIAQAAKAVGSMFSNPYTAIGGVVIAIIIVVVMIFFVIYAAITAIVPSFSLRSENPAVVNVYLYVSELDAQKQYGIVSQEEIEHEPEIEEFRYFLNGEETTRDKMIVYTRRDIMLAYLDSKYEDYSFGEVEGVILNIHEILHQVVIEEWHYTYEVYHEDTDPEDDVDDSWTEEVTVYCMDIFLITQKLETYIMENIDDLLDEVQQEKYDALHQVGIYSMKKDLPSPFPGSDWDEAVITPWGEYIESYLDEDGETIIYEKKYHPGVDIAMAEGTSVRSCMTGTAEVGYDEELGYYVKVSKGDNYTLYANLSRAAVTNGDTVEVGETIGYVGDSGNLSKEPRFHKEPHLHLEYHEKGVNLCPLIFIEGGGGSIY